MDLRCNRICALAALAMLIALAPAATAQNTTAWPRRDGVVLAKFKETSSRESVAAILRELGATVIERLACLDVDVLRFRAGGHEEALAGKLCDSGLAEWAHPDWLATPCVTPDDPYYGYQWHHAVIKSPAAWDVTPGSAAIIVGIVDSGVDASHPDLAGKVLPGWNTVSHSTDSSDIMGHGTSSAGSAAATGSNHIGVAGVSWHSKILPVRVSNSASGGAYDSAIADGIVWAADHGAKVISISMGPLYGSIFDSAAKYAESKDAIVLVATGNSGTEYPGWPDYASIVYVGATGTSDTKTSFSSYGTYVDCTAPGVSIVTTAKGGGYTYFAGTSASCPVAAGVAALIRAAKPSLKVAEVKAILLATCDDKGAPGEDVLYGKGRVNAHAAVVAAAAAGGAPPGGGGPPPTNVPPTVGSVTATPTSGYAPLTVSLTASASDPDGTIVSITWTFGDGTSGSGASVSHTYTATGTFTATAKATDDKGAFATKSVTITVTPPPDTTPPSKPLILSVVDAKSGGTLILTWKKNPEADVAHYVIVRYDDKTGYKTIGTFPASATTLTDPGLVNGQDYWYFVRAVDFAGNKSAWSDYKGAIPTGP